MWANAIYCDGYKVYCTESTDTIKLRVSAAGQLIYHEVSCEDLFAQAGIGSYSNMVSNLANDMSTFTANDDTEYEY